jgi:hypothetical protein
MSLIDKDVTSKVTYSYTLPLDIIVSIVVSIGPLVRL